MKLICFEDQIVSQLQPITYARPAYAITCASYQLLDWLRLLPGDLSVAVRNYLATLESLDAGLASPSDAAVEGQDVLLVNARLVPRVETLRHLKTIATSEASGVIRCASTGAILVARLGKSETTDLNSNQTEVSGAAKPEVASPFKKSVGQSTDELQKLSGGETVKKLIAKADQIDHAPWQIDADDLPAFQWPHEVVAWHMKEMPDAMTYRLEHGNYTETKEGVFVAEGVSIGDYAVINTDDGPILFDEGVSVGPFCFLAGPVYAGKKTRVIEHAALKDGVALGHTVKIGGEVEASVIEPYTNKQHHGFLGHSYLGSWINLGAGTCNSDLKNTYGKINIEYGGEKVATGMQFLGCIMGDYSKTAINTSIFTGKVIGVCSMLYGFATSNVPSFVNYARLFGQQSLLPAEVMINTQQRMFARRKVEQRECDIQLIQDMYRLSAAERDGGDPYSF
ncbi:putative sugar nucleotidyl transferase [Roseiconus lacunae]|uniref:Sugar nucleotidyl transferase n=1 Tax=Roseiconus lacunae TaxID=2605694 RepID=A0ABT7PBK6_9BACT|nr:putative sugar nucleotidyl transferase [Roseiconus lacunae]MCD0463076.1 glucose-1-phosphate thymidylyltransferase [Roseiconus lacunae]MDM4013874.1 putative sugar nucleotidyl transferase [Roseiconus lacunae]